MTKIDPLMSRKEFLKKSAAAAIGVGMAAHRPADTEASGLATKALGRTGIRIVPVGFGATRTMEPMLMRAALDSGINFFDTGRHYFNGRNELLVGEALSGRRKDVVIQSKLQLGVREEDAGRLTSQDVARMTAAMAKSLEESLKALRTDYVDIMLIHNANLPKLAHHEAIREFFTAAKKAGKIRAHGFSSHSNHVQMLREAARERFFDVVMLPYNHKGSYVHANSGRSIAWDQSSLETEMKQAAEAGIGLIAMKTCSGGPCPTPGGGKPSFQEALRWILKRNRVHGLAVAMGNFQQLKEDMQALS